MFYKDILYLRLIISTDKFRFNRIPTDIGKMDIMDGDEKEVWTQKPVPSSRLPGAMYRNRQTAFVGK